MQCSVHWESRKVDRLLHIHKFPHMQLCSLQPLGLQVSSLSNQALVWSRRVCNKHTVLNFVPLNNYYRCMQMKSRVLLKIKTEMNTSEMNLEYYKLLKRQSEDARFN